MENVAAAVEDDFLDAGSDGALGDHCHLTTPRQPTKAEYVQLIQESWG